PHWGYVLEGKLTVSFADGRHETAATSDLFYWPPGHTVKADADTEMILFSPQHEHGQVLNHVLEKLQG
ncbi:MAG: cupin domain-containing protein, partial [Thermodesulfobacteriota bacterium]